MCSPSRKCGCCFRAFFSSLSLAFSLAHGHASCEIASARGEAAEKRGQQEAARKKEKTLLNRKPKTAKL